jgi:adenosylmethionine-8-amino-7-oxononanoate aminotransferase
MQPPFNISIYPGSGTADGVMGDHVLLAPAYNITSGEVRLIVDTVATVVEAFFHGPFAVNGD